MVAVFYFRKQISLPMMKAVVGTCTCANSLDHLDYGLFIFGSHSRNQDEFTISFISRLKFIVSIFRGKCSNLRVCEFS